MPGIAIIVAAAVLSVAVFRVALLSDDPTPPAEAPPPDVALGAYPASPTVSVVCGAAPPAVGGQGTLADGKASVGPPVQQPVLIGSQALPILSPEFLATREAALNRTYLNPCSGQRGSTPPLHAVASPVPGTDTYIP